MKSMREDLRQAFMEIGKKASEKHDGATVEVQKTVERIKQAVYYYTQVANTIDDASLESALTKLQAQLARIG